MNKEEIVKHYTRATRSEQSALTQYAREWLAKNGIQISRDSLHHWRNKEMTRSPLNGKYRQAYEYAIKEAEKRAEIAQ